MSLRTWRVSQFPVGISVLLLVVVSATSFAQDEAAEGTFGTYLNGADPQVEENSSYISIDVKEKDLNKLNEPLIILNMRLLTKQNFKKKSQ